MAHRILGVMAKAGSSTDTARLYRLGFAFMSSAISYKSRIRAQEALPFIQACIRSRLNLT